MRHLFRGIVVLVTLGIVGVVVAIVAIALPFPQMPPEVRVWKDAEMDMAHGISS